MTREDLLKGNAGVAEELGKNIKQYCPDVKHVVVIFNPADITRPYHPDLVWSASITGNDTCCPRQYPSAERAR